MEYTPVGQVLFSKGTLMDLDIGRWAGIKKLQPDDMLISKLDQSVIYLGHKKLVPKEATAKLINIEGKARFVLASKSTFFPIAGARFVSWKALPELIDKLKSLKKSFTEQVDKLLADYPSLKQHQLQLLAEQAERLAKEELKKASIEQRTNRWKELQEWMVTQNSKNALLYPDVSSLKYRFRFEWRTFNISLASAEDIKDEELSKLIAAHNKLDEDLQNWVKEITTEIHKQLGLAAKHAKTLLEEQGKLNPKNLKPFFDALEVFKSVDFAGSDWQKILGDIKEKFASSNGSGIDYKATAEELNASDWSKQEFHGLLDKISSLALDDVAKEAGIKTLKAGEFARVIEL